MLMTWRESTKTMMPTETASRDILVHSLVFLRPVFAAPTSLLAPWIQTAGLIKHQKDSVITYDFSLVSWVARNPYKNATPTRQLSWLDNHPPMKD